MNPYDLIDPPDGAAPPGATQIPPAAGANPYDAIDPPDFAQRAAAMDPVDLSVARSKNDAFGAYLREQAQRPVKGEAPAARERRLYGSLSDPSGAPGVGEGITRSYVQGGTVGGGDEIVAAGAAALNKLTGKDPGRPYSEVYGAYLERERAKLAKFRESNPVTATVSEIGGAIPTMMAAPSFTAAKTAHLLTRMGIGAANAAGQGAVYGYNAGEGGAGQRFLNAARTSAIAAPVGGAVPVVAAGAGKYAQNLMRTKDALKAGMSRPTADTLEAVVRADAALSGPGAKRIAAAGPRAMLGDGGASARGLMDTINQQGGSGARRIGKAVGERAAAAGDDMTAALDDAFGRAQGTKGVARRIAQSTAPERQAAYDLAYSRPINYASNSGRAVEEALERVPNGTMKAAVKEANDIMREKAIRNRQILIDVADDGSVTFKQMPDVLQLDMLKRALDNIGAKAKDQFGRPLPEGLRAMRLARRIKAATGDAVPEYLAAVQKGGSKIERDQGLLLGRDIFKAKTTYEDAADFLNNASDAAKKEAAKGVRQQIDTVLSRVKKTLGGAYDEANIKEALKAYSELSSRDARAKIKLIVGPEKAAALFKTLDQSGMSLSLRAAMSDGTRTFGRQVARETSRKLKEDGAFNAIREGRPIEGPRRLTAKLLGRSPAQKLAIDDALDDELAKALTQARGPQAEVVRRTLERSTPRALARGALTRRLTEKLLADKAPAPAIVGLNQRGRSRSR